jgi:hypothetical protein
MTNYLEVEAHALLLRKLGRAVAWEWLLRLPFPPVGPLPDSRSLTGREGPFERRGLLAAIPAPRARRRPPSPYANDRACDASTHPPASSLLREAAPAGWAGPHVPSFRAGRSALPEGRWPDEAPGVHLRPPRAPPHLSLSRPAFRAPRPRSRPLSAPGRLRLGSVAPSTHSPRALPESLQGLPPQGESSDQTPHPPPMPPFALLVASLSPVFARSSTHPERLLPPRTPRRRARNRTFF